MTMEQKLSNNDDGGDSSLNGAMYIAACLKADGVEKYSGNAATPITA